MWEILIPVAGVSKPSIHIPTMTSIKDKTIAFISNEAWVCLPTMWAKIDELLKKNYDVAHTFKVPVPASSPCPPEIVKEVVASSDAAIVALANWGSCTAWSIHDGIELMLLGKPVVVLINEDFLNTSTITAKSRGLAQIPNVLYPRTINIMTEVEIEEVVTKTIDKIVSSLITGRG